MLRLPDDLPFGLVATIVLLVCLGVISAICAIVQVPHG